MMIVNANWGKFFVLLCLAAGVLMACSKPTEHPLVGTEWTLVSINSKDLIPESSITATFEDNIIVGYTGCNQYNADIEINTDTISYIKVTFVTEVACIEPERMEQERMYLQTLETITKYILKDKQLEMINGDGDIVLIFEDGLP